MSEGFAGDPFHEGSAKPMAHLKGGMDGVHIQQPMSGENSGDTDGNTVTPGVSGWASTTLGVTPKGTGANSNPVH